MREPALVIQDLSVRYGNRRALGGVNLSAFPGELVAVTGPNGSGKTTLLRAALALVSPEAGRVKVTGHPVASLSPRERARRVAWVPQEEAPRDNVPIGEYVLWGRYAHLRPFSGESEADRALAREALAEVGLWDRREEGIFSLSGGERQRVLLARALTQGAPVLLMDEPTAHLDIGHQLDLFERVRRLLRERGTCVVAAMHDLNLAARFADRIAVLSRGSLVSLGTPQEVLTPGILRRVWGVDAERRIDARTGRPFLLPHLAVPEPTSASLPAGDFGPVHVVGGGGAASSILRRLSTTGVSVTCGVLHLLDSDFETASELGIPVAAEVPFSAISPAARAQLERLLESARAIVVGPFWVGPANLANLETLRPHVGRKPVIFVGGGSIAGRDSSGGVGTALVRELLARGAIDVPDEDQLIEALRRTSVTDEVRGPSPAV